MATLYRSIIGFPDYFACNDGTVWKLVDGRWLFKRKPRKRKDGYLGFSIFVDSIQKSFLVHRLIAIAFIPNPENLKEINHINGDKSDNRVENLEWTTRSKNIKHSYDNLGAIHSRPRGIKQWQAKFTDDEVRSIRELSESGKSHNEISEIIGKSVTSTNVGNIRSGRTYRHIK
jgi:HNH endonuclease